MDLPLFIKERLKDLSLRFILAAAIFLLALFAFATIADEVVLERENGLDDMLFNWGTPLVSPTMTTVLKGFPFWGLLHFCVLPVWCSWPVFCFGKKKNGYELKLPPSPAPAALPTGT